MNRILNLFYLIQYSIDLQGANHERGKYHKLAFNTCRESIKASYRLADANGHERVFKRIQWYMVNTYMMGKLFTGFYLKKKPDTLLRKKLFLTGAVIGISDILIDEDKLTKAAFEDLYFGKRMPETLNEKIFKLYLENLLALFEPNQKADFLETFDEAGYKQLNSAHQLNQQITGEESTQISAEKGGASILLCASLLTSLSDMHKKALHQLGAYIQFLNDAQDIVKDAHEGVRTFVAFCNTVDEIVDFLDTEKKKAFIQFMQQNHNDAKTGRFLLCFELMHNTIESKLHRFKELHGNAIQHEKLKQMDRRILEKGVFSMKSIFRIAGKSLKFDLNRFTV